jgi:hypothetical protein
MQQQRCEQHQGHQQQQLGRQQQQQNTMTVAEMAGKKGILATAGAPASVGTRTAGTLTTARTIAAEETQERHLSMERCTKKCTVS